MGYNQIYSVVNAATQQALGASAVQAIDSSTLIDVGGQVLDNSNPATFNAWVYGLMGVINVTRIKAKSYDGISRVSGYRNSEEYGLYQRKIQSNYVADVVENSSYKAQDWNYYNGDLTDNWTDRLFGTMGGFESEPEIISRKKLARCFHNVEEMGAFIAMLDTNRLNSIRAAIESTEMLARATAIGASFERANTVVDLGALYTQATGDSVNAGNWLYNPDFIRFAIFEIKRVAERLKSMNRVYNNAGFDRFTRDNELVIDIHTDFSSAMAAFLNSTLIEKFIKLPGYNEVSRWQGLGTSVESVEKLDITNDKLNASTTAFPSNVSNDGKTVTIPALIAYVHDIDRYAHTINDLRTVSAENTLQEMTTIVTKFDTAWSVDPSEQGVAFIVGAAS